MYATNSIRHWLKLAVFLLVFTCGAAHAADAADPAAGIKAKMPAEWMGCSADSDCSLLPFNCGDFLAVNGKHLSEAKDLAYQIASNPATINCLETGTPPTYQAICSSGTCEARASSN